MDTPIRTIGFIGLGLIGGSIAKAIHQYHPHIRIYGHASHADTLALAHHEAIIENDHFLPLSEFARMDILFLCAPVQRNIDYVRQLAPMLLGNHCLVTDVGSVKNGIQQVIDELGLSQSFIGGHPMTGSEKDGFSYSSPQFLENAYYILTRHRDFDEKRFRRFQEFIASLGSITLETTPAIHDYATAAISHLPHIVAAALVNLIREHDTPEKIMGTIAAGGFKDITRISSSSPVMWQNICVENRDEIQKLIDLYGQTILSARALVEKSDEEALISFFSSAKDYRDSMPTIKTGFLPRIYDFYLDMADEAGQIACVASILAERRINIKNIGIVHNREFGEGVLHIELYDDESKSAAMKVLKKQGYIIRRR